MIAVSHTKEKNMNADDFEYLLSNPKLLGDKWREILESTQGDGSE